jgi:hypothetical protein
LDNQEGVDVILNVGGENVSCPQGGVDVILSVGGEVSCPQLHKVVLTARPHAIRSQFFLWLPTLSSNRNRMEIVM